MSKTTPGPWRKSDVAIVVADIPNGEYATTAVAYCGDEFRHLGGLPFGEERDANARLIAAAPEMYEALQRIAQEMEAGLDEYANRRGNLIGIAKFAIAKAEGRK